MASTSRFRVRAAVDAARRFALVGRESLLGSEFIAALDEVANAIEPALDALFWQPIETAPKDGEKVLGYWAADPDCGSDVDVVWFELDVWVNDRGRVDPPTHWRPIGPGPEGK